MLPKVKQWQKCPHMWLFEWSGADRFIIDWLYPCRTPRNGRGSGANFWFEVNWIDALRIDHVVSTAFQIAGSVWACFGNLPRLNWFLRMR